MKAGRPHRGHGSRVNERLLGRLKAPRREGSRALRQHALGGVLQHGVQRHQGERELGIEPQRRRGAVSPPPLFGRWCAPRAGRLLSQGVQAAQNGEATLPSLHSPFWAPDAEQVIATGAEALADAALRLMPRG